LFFLTLLLATALTGCSSVSLEKARANFYNGRFVHANENLKDIPQGDRDEILCLTERGMIRQTLHLYDESNKDWRKATEINDELAKYSVSRETASLLSNDRVITYRGMPFERTLIYTFLAKNYLAQYNWDYATICARNIISHLENPNGFPDISYSRYLAGFCLEMINDKGNAAIQYRAAAKVMNNISIDPDSGRITALSSNITGAVNTNELFVKEAGKEPYELVCFIGIGKMPKWCRSEYEFDMAPSAWIYSGNKYLGRSYPLANTAALMVDSKKRLAVLQAGKDIARVVVKEVIAQSVESQNQALGELTRLILFSLEQPDTRCWETLPLWLEVARVPCPAKLENYRVEFKTSNGVTLKSKTISAPITRRGNIYVSFCRDLDLEGE
jgi:tetratricopeptide (TPR) repeat protein